MKKEEKVAIAVGAAAAVGAGAYYLLKPKVEEVPPEEVPPTGWILAGEVIVDVPVGLAPPAGWILAGEVTVDVPVGLAPPAGWIVAGEVTVDVPVGLALPAGWILAGEVTVDVPVGLAPPAGWILAGETEVTVPVLALITFTVYLVNIPSWLMPVSYWYIIWHSKAYGVVGITSPIKLANVEPSGVMKVVVKTATGFYNFTSKSVTLVDGGVYNFDLTTLTVARR
ncbi:MAG: hypothetical protein JRD89_03845 [Deltaproteobacteria bacterium]|nr:hypothetical protein [Deltaproteobacteria bacterium]